MFIKKNGKVIINSDGSVEITGFSIDMKGDGNMNNAQKLCGEWAIKQIQAAISGEVTFNKTNQAASVDRENDAAE